MGDWDAVRAEMDAIDAERRSAKAIAAGFHQTYEQLAPQYEYRTRADSAVPWVDVPTENKQLMIATVVALLRLDVIRPGENHNG